MSLSSKTLLSTRAQATPTTVVAADEPLPDNCHTVIIYNPDGTNEVYVAEAVPDTNNPLDQATSTRIKAGAYLTMTIGSKTSRLQNMVLGYSTSAGTFDVNVTYLCSNVV